MEWNLSKEFDFEGIGIGMLSGLTSCLVGRIGMESVERIGICLFGSQNVALELE